ncbi:hypothetical protein BTUL_0034g00390 [Botrytis tulipae]|uniref:Uncharacterized protein n=1 Tax=Botrytis tulipae TaxID=87230 RepID=A0A4Z1F476_9HELO|nr:hypothetical protein BTUL_0034g00390 [Botrytis tulipae]
MWCSTLITFLKLQICTLTRGAFGKAAAYRFISCESESESERSAALEGLYGAYPAKLYSATNDAVKMRWRAGGAVLLLRSAVLDAGSPACVFSNGLSQLLNVACAIYALVI